jgi:hypothetical protein
MDSGPIRCVRERRPPPCCAWACAGSETDTNIDTGKRQDAMQQGWLLERLIVNGLHASNRVCRETCGQRGNCQECRSYKARRSQPVNATPYTFGGIGGCIYESWSVGDCGIQTRRVATEPFSRTEWSEESRQVTCLRVFLSRTTRLCSRTSGLGTTWKELYCFGKDCIVLERTLLFGDIAVLDKNSRKQEPSHYARLQPSAESTLLNEVVNRLRRDNSAGLLMRN